jgi:Ca2+-transporting ATPase
MAGSALRVLACAYQELPSPSTAFSPEALEHDLIFAGLVGIMDPPRPEVAEAIGRCHDAGIRVLMITGDHRLTAIAIGREIGLISGEAPSLTGEEMEQLSNGELAEVLAQG